jgi:hypothetical protein
MKKYYDEFESWEDIQKEFGERNDRPLTIPEPNGNVLASYTWEDYEGDANVLYRDNDRIFYVDGGHCSCYGLEGQWHPEEYTTETLAGQVERAKYGFFKDRADEIKELFL